MTGNSIQNKTHIGSFVLYATQFSVEWVKETYVRVYAIFPSDTLVHYKARIYNPLSNSFREEVTLQN
jgi:hypothetical protein